MNDARTFIRVWRGHGLAQAMIKALARVAGKRVLVEGLDTDFPASPAPRDLAMPTMDDALRWHTGYGGRWKHVLPLPNERMMLHIGAASVDNSTSSCSRSSLAGSDMSKTVAITANRIPIASDGHPDGARFPANFSRLA